MPLRLIAALALIAGALFSGAVAWSAWAAKSGPVGKPPIALHHGRALTQQAAESCLERPCAVEDAVERAGKILEARPYSDAALLIVAYSQSMTGDAAKAETAEKLAALALKRTPRSALAHGMLADAAATKNDAKARLFHLERLMELEMNGSEQFIAAISQIGQTPAGLELLAARAKEKPAWLQNVVVDLNAAGVDPERLLVLSNENIDLQTVIFNRLIRERGPVRAFEVWGRLHPQHEVKAWPFDADFKNLAASGPFNWQISPGRSEFRPSGGLYADYQGKGLVGLAEQTMMLKPGAHRLAFAMEGQNQENGGKLAWSLDCLPNIQRIGELKIPMLTTTSQKYALTVSVPAQGCEGQRLMLFGAPGEFPLAAQGLVTGVTVEPAIGPQPAERTAGSE